MNWKTARGFGGGGGGHGGGRGALTSVVFDCTLIIAGGPLNHRHIISCGNW